MCKNGCFLLLSFELSPLNELNSGKLVPSITLYTLQDILMIFGIHINQGKMICHVQEWLLPLAALLSHFP